MRKIALSLLLAMSIGAATTASSQSPQTAAPALDPAWKVPEVISFIGLKKGDKVADIVAGRLTASLAQTVGPSGKVYAVETAEIVKAHPQIMDRMKALAAQSPNVVVSDDPVAAALPSGLDVVFIRQNYHDLYDKFMGPADVPAFNKAVFAALKPGGVYVVLDHAAAAGSGTDATETLHRIDPARVKFQTGWREFDSCQYERRSYQKCVRPFRAWSHRPVPISLQEAKVMSAKNQQAD